MYEVASMTEVPPPLRGPSGALAPDGLPPASLAPDWLHGPVTYWTGLHVCLDRTRGKVSAMVSVDWLHGPVPP